MGGSGSRGWLGGLPPRLIGGYTRDRANETISMSSGFLSSQRVWVTKGMGEQIVKRAGL